MRATFARYVALLISLTAVSVLWMVLQFVTNVVFSIWGEMRGDGQLWLLVMKDGMSPAIAAYCAFAILGRFKRNTQWRLLFIWFALTLVIMTAWGTAGLQDFYLQSNRISRWHEILWGSIAGVVAGTIGAAIFCFQQPIVTTQNDIGKRLSFDEKLQRLHEIEANRPGEKGPGAD